MGTPGLGSGPTGLVGLAHCGRPPGFRRELVRDTLLVRRLAALRCDLALACGIHAGEAAGPLGDASCSVRGAIRVARVLVVIHALSVFVG